MKTRNKTKQQNASESLEDQGLLEVKFINTYIGSGVFSKSNIRKGTFICVYPGENISEEEGLHRLERNKQPGCYLYFYKKDGKKCCVDGTHSFGVGKYINDDHKKPNAIVKLKVLDGKSVLAVYALKDISQGNEIRYDYGDSLAHWRKKNAEPESLYAPPEGEISQVFAQSLMDGSAEKSVDSISDLQPQNVLPTSRVEAMESESEGETSQVFVQPPIDGSAEKFVDSNSDLQSQNVLPTSRVEAMQSESEGETSQVFAEPPMDRSAEKSVESNSDLQSQNVLPTSRVEAMESESEGETSQVFAQPLMDGSAEKSIDSIRDLQPQKVLPTSRVTAKEPESEGETSQIFVQLPMDGSAEKSVDSNSDLQSQNVLPTSIVEAMASESEGETSQVFAQPPMDRSAEKSVDSNSDLQSQNVLPTSRDAAIEPKSEGETSQVFVQLPIDGSAEKSVDSNSDLQSQNVLPTSRVEAMESEIEGETSQVFAQPPMDRSAEKSVDSNSDLQSQNVLPTSRVEAMESESERETSEVCAQPPMDGCAVKSVDSVSDLQPQKVLPTSRVEAMESESEGETSQVFAQPPMDRSAEKSVDSNSDLQSQNVLPTSRVTAKEPESEGETSQIFVQPPMDGSAEKSVESNSDLQSQNVLPTSRVESMESESEGETSEVCAQPPMDGSAEKSVDSVSDLQPQKVLPTSRVEAMESESEGETSQVFAQPPMDGSAEKSVDSKSDLQSQNVLPTSRVTAKEPESEGETSQIFVQPPMDGSAEKSVESNSDLQSQNVLPTSRVEAMESESEGETSEVCAQSPMDGRAGKSVDSVSDLQPQKVLPTSRVEAMESESEGETSQIFVQLPMDGSAEKSVESNSDLQSQNVLPTSRVEAMESESEGETSQIFAQPPIDGSAEKSVDSNSDLQSQNVFPTFRVEAMESESEGETSQVFAQPLMDGSAEKSVDSIRDLQPQNVFPTSRVTAIEPESGDEVVDSAESEAGSEIWPALSSGNIDVPNEQDEFEAYDDDVLDPDYLPEEDCQETNSDYSNPRDDCDFQSDSFIAELIPSSSVTSSSDNKIPDFQSDSFIAELIPSSSVTSSSDNKIPDFQSDSFIADPIPSSSVTSSSDNNIPVITVEKRSSNLVKGQRDFKRKHICFVCEKNVCDIPRHAAVAHEDDDLVKAALSKQKGSKERRAIWKVFINKGAFKANIRAKAVGGELQVSKRTGINRKPDEYQPCIYCYGYFLKKDLWRHTKNCSSSVFKGYEKKKNCIQSNIKAVSATVDLVSCVTAGSSELLERFHDKLKIKDDAYIVVKQDRLLQLYTKSLLEEGKSYTDTSWTVRLLGKLLLKARDISTNTNLSWMELIDHVNWKILAAGIRSLAEFKYDQDKVTVGRANIGIKCGQGVRGLIAAFEGYALGVDDDFLLQKAKKMLMNFEKEWPKMQKRCRESRKVDREDQEDNLLPLTDDIGKLRKYCVGQINSLSSEMQRECDHQNYKQLQTLVLARLISFNARRGGEPGKLKIKQWQSIYQGKGIHREEINALPEEEKLLAERMRLGYVLGKGLKRVPVLFPDETVSAINILLKHRESVISNPDNPYVFGRLRKNSVDYMRGSDCIRQICNEAGLQHSSLITATQLRKYLSTTLQLIDMTEAELRWITDHMGHTIDVHKKWYRMSHKTVELSKVASILVAAETGRLQKAHSIPFDEVFSHARTPNDNSLLPPSPLLEVEFRVAEFGQTKMVSSSYSLLEADSHAVHAQPPMDGSAEKSVDSNSDLQPQNVLPTSSFVAMESESETGTPPVAAMQPLAGNAKQSQNRPLTPRVNEMESDSEAESLPICEQPSVTSKTKESMDNMGDLLPRKRPPTSREEGIKPIKENKKQIHRPWCHQERTALFDAFSSYLVPKCRRLPGKREIMKVQGQCKGLGNRTWQNIKYQLKNMQCKI